MSEKIRRIKGTENPKKDPSYVLPPDYDPDKVKRLKKPDK